MHGQIFQPIRLVLEHGNPVDEVGVTQSADTFLEIGFEHALGGSFPVMTCSVVTHQSCSELFAALWGQ